MAQADTNIIANDEFPKIIAESATSYCQGSMGSESLCKIGTSGTARYVDYMCRGRFHKELGLVRT